MSICSKCGQENREEARFCTECGTELVPETPQKPIFCVQCGAQNERSQVLCSNCGAELLNKAVIEPVKPITPYMPLGNMAAIKPSPKKGLLIGGIAAAAALLIGMAVLLFVLLGGGNAYEKKYDTALKFMESSSYEEAIVAYTAAIKIDPKAPQAYRGLVSAYAASGQPDKAREAQQDGYDNTGDPMLNPEKNAVELTWKIEPTFDFDSVVQVQTFPYFLDLSIDDDDRYLMRAMVTKNGQTGVVSITGKEIIPTSTNVHWTPYYGFVDDAGNTYEAKGNVVNAVPFGNEIIQFSFFDKTSNRAISYTYDMNAQFGRMENMITNYSGYLLPVIEINNEFELPADMSFSQDTTVGNVLDYEKTDQYVFYSGVDNDAKDMFFTAVKTTPEVYDPAYDIMNRNYIDVEYGGIGYFCGRLSDGSWHHYDENGEDLGLGGFEDAKPFSLGYAAVKQNGKWGYIDTEENTVVPFVFEDAASVCGIRAWAKYNGLWGVVIMGLNGQPAGSDVYIYEEPEEPEIPEIPISQPNYSIKYDANGVVQPTFWLDEYERGHFMVSATGGLRLRKGPSTDYERILTVPDYSTLIEYSYMNGWMYTEYNGHYGWVSKQYITEPYGMAKPVIYLYPESTIDVNVSLEIKDGKLSCTYPSYNSGWNVTAQPDGTLTNKADGREYSYLYWEGEGSSEFDMSKGFVVKGSDTASFLQQKLEYMGLTPKEYNEFIVYWLPLMQNNPYNLITFQTTAYTENAVLEITPKPDSLLRIYMVYKPLDKPIDIPQPTLAPFERKGFAVVEWGGTELK